jgi:hypothetical protein
MCTYTFTQHVYHFLVNSSSIGIQIWNKQRKYTKNNFVEGKVIKYLLKTFPLQLTLFYHFVVSKFMFCKSISSSLKFVVD